MKKEKKKKSKKRIDENAERDYISWKNILEN